MRPKILIFLTLLAVLTSVTVVSSCMKSKEIKRCKLADAEKLLIPYKLGQIVSFIDSTGTVIAFTVTENKTEWSSDREGSFRSDYMSNEVKKTTLQSESKNLEISLYISNANCNPDYYNPSIFDTGWLSIHFQSPSVSVYAVLSTDTRGNFLFNVSESNSTSKHNSMEFNNKVFYEVIEYNNEWKNNDQITTTQLFYNKTFGVLQICRNDTVLIIIKN